MGQGHCRKFSLPNFDSRIQAQKTTTECLLGGCLVGACGRLVRAGSSVCRGRAGVVFQAALTAAWSLCVSVCVVQAPVHAAAVPQPSDGSSSGSSSSRRGHRTSTVLAAAAAAARGAAGAASTQGGHAGAAAAGRCGPCGSAAGRGSRPLSICSISSNGSWPGNQAGAGVYCRVGRWCSAAWLGACVLRCFSSRLHRVDAGAVCAHKYWVLCSVCVQLRMFRDPCLWSD